ANFPGSLPKAEPPEMRFTTYVALRMGGGPQNLPDFGEQPIVGRGLVQNGEGAGVLCLPGEAGIAVAGQNDAGHRKPSPAPHLEQFEAGQAGQEMVENEATAVHPMNPAQEDLRAGIAMNRPPLPFKQELERFPDRAIVVDDANARRAQCPEVSAAREVSYRTS